MIGSRSAAVAALALLLVLGGASAAHGSTPRALRLSPLHAEPDPRSGGRIVDARGREVLLRGVNVNALAEYWRGNRFRTVFPLARRDPARMAGIGWNTVRLLVSWSRIEPRPGVFDRRYLKRVEATVARLARAGIYSILDLHQDAWGPSLAARPGEVCPAGSVPALGWDGAPGWATLAGDAARCDAGTRELSPAVLAAWSAFFANSPGPGGVGIRTRYVRMVGRVARRFARSTAVAGFDLMNEPNAFGAEQGAALSRLYAEALAAVRAGERRGRGRRHLVLFEPSALWSSTGSGAPPAFRHDRDVVYAPHIYTGGFTGGPIGAAAFATARAEARVFGGAPVLSGEWGADPDRAGARGDGYFLRHQALQDRFRVSATMWTWRESCGDPHKVGDLRAGRVPEVWGPFEVSCRTNRVSRLRRALVAELTRGYVRAAPGRLLAGRWRPGSGLAASGRASRGDGPLVAFLPVRTRAVPEGPDQYLPSPCRTVRICLRIRTRGLRDLRLLRAPGGGRYVVARPKGGAWALRVRSRGSAPVS